MTSFDTEQTDLITLTTEERLSDILHQIPAIQRTSVAELLPRACSALAVELHAPFLQIIQAVTNYNARPLPAVIPLAAATLRNFPEIYCGELLERLVQLARVFPAGLVPLLRSLGRAYDEAGDAGVFDWIAVGEELGCRNAHAGEAFFALQSRTSLLTLRGAAPAVRLSEVQGVLLKFLHMLSRQATGFIETQELFLPPQLAHAGQEWIPLPRVIDLFPSYEENFRLYRVFVAHQAGRLLYGTYDCRPSTMWSSLPPSALSLIDEPTPLPDDLPGYFLLFPRPDLIGDLFLCVEGRRIAARLSATYRGLANDLAWADGLTELYPAVLAGLLAQLSAEDLADHVHNGTAADSLIWASALYAQLLQDEQPLPSGSPSFTEIDSDDVPGESAAFLTGVDTSRGGSGAGSDEEEIAQRRARTTRDLHYVYDEWDYEIDDYRPHWCELREVRVAEDTGAFFSRTLASYAELAPDIKREFQRLRPRMFQAVTGLEDGEDIDLNAMVNARVDRQLGNTPSAKLYIARQQVKRDVGVLFLVDLSASTAAELPKNPESDPSVSIPEQPRVIDLIKEALVLLSVALEEIGDSYAIYGFSSRGRHDVEVFPVKTFRDSLSSEVKGRIGALTPQGSTRMGAAVRHATRRLKDLATRAKLLVLLSDGYPEDPGYGKPVVPPMYGLRDTLMAFREAERSGILSYCLTIDKGGHDYLQEMCAPSRYMVIEDIRSLPTELPKIYQRYIWSQWL